jgi:hypothetical protein
MRHLKALAILLLCTSASLASISCGVAASVARALRTLSARSRA